MEVVADGFLTYRLPTSAHVLVGNLPFHQTTAILRRILYTPAWTDAIVLVQWEVARRRAGVGGATMMTAQWAPWFEFTLHSRIPARAFTPRPGVDGGILTIHRREHPLLTPAERRQFHALVHRVYTGPGHGLAQILARNTSLGSPQAAQAWLRGHSVNPAGLPKDSLVEAHTHTAHCVLISQLPPATDRRLDRAVELPPALPFRLPPVPVSSGFVVHRDPLDHPVRDCRCGGISAVQSCGGLLSGR